MFNKKILAVALASIGMQSAYAADAAGINDMDTVVVTASLQKHTVASAPAFATVLSTEDIEKSPVNSLADLLRETVGVANVTDDSGRDQISIRGLDGKYTLMLVNGKRVSSTGALWRGSDFDFNSIPLSSIKRVEIVRGPMAALYGSDAIGGVVNIITKTPTKDWKGSVTGEYRQVASGDKGNQHKLSANVSGAVNDALSLSLNGEIYDRDPWFAPGTNPAIQSPALEEKKSHNFVGSATWKLAENQSLDFDLAYANDKRPYGVYYYYFDPASKYEARDLRAQESKRTTFGVTHKGSWDWGSTHAYLSRETTKIDDFNTRYNAPQQRNLKEENTYAKFYANVSLGINALAAGVDLRRQEIKDAVSFVKTGKAKIDSSALFVEDEITLSDSLRLTLSGRADHNDSFGNHFSPKGYLTYALNKDITIKGGVSKAFKAPEAYQTNAEYGIISCGGNCMLYGNPALEPETSTNYEGGIEIRKKTWGASAVVFKNDVDDMILAAYDPALKMRRWTNINKAKTSGLELQGDVQLHPQFSVSANYTHLNADAIDNQGKKTQIDSRPKNTAHVSFDWKPLPWLTSSLSSNYIGKQFYEQHELPSYTRTDLALSAKVDKVVLRFGVKNLGNVNLDKKDKNFQSNELGRNYYASATYNF